MTEQKIEEVSLVITEGHIILVAEVLRIERCLDHLPMKDAVDLLTQALKNTTNRGTDK